MDDVTRSHVAMSVCFIVVDDGERCNTSMLLYQLQYIYSSLYSIYTVVAIVQT
jgi:hypothetical protein